MFSHADMLSDTPRLRRFSLKLTRNASDSEDLYQSTMERALEKRHLFEEGTNFFSWSSRIMYNLFVSRVRHTTRAGTTSYDPSTLADVVSQEPNQHARIELRSLLDCVAALPSGQREVVELTCFEGLPYEEVARRLAVPVGTVRSRLARAREKLAESMEGLAPTPRHRIH